MLPDRWSRGCRGAAGPGGGILTAGRFRLLVAGLVAGLVLAAALPTQPAAAAAAPAHDEPSHRFGDWLAACDNQLDCIADGFGAGDTPAALLLSRPRGAPFTVTLVLRPDGSPRPDSLRLQAARRGPAVSVRLHPAEDGTSRGGLTAGEVTALLPSLRSGGRLTLTQLASHPGARGAVFGSIGLADAGAALDWIEERQRRLPEPLPAIPAVPPGDGAPIDRHRVPLAVAALPSVRACRRQDADDPATDTGAWRLSRTVSLWQIPCGSGNFDRSTLFVLAGPGGERASPAGFTTLSQMALHPPGILVNAETGADGNKITAIEPSRGLGDCGDLRSYRWDGTRFRLALARLMTACRGLGPEDWPVIYRTRP